MPVRLRGIDGYHGGRCTNHLSSFLERFGVNLDQDHREVLVRGAALMRSAAGHNDEIAFLDFKGFAIDDARAGVRNNTFFRTCPISERMYDDLPVPGAP